MPPRKRTKKTSSTPSKTKQSPSEEPTPTAPSSAANAANGSSQSPKPDPEEKPTPDIDTKSETGSVALSAASEIDPAVLDEEEIPDEPALEAQVREQQQQHITHGPGGGGYNALKQFNGQYYAGMQIGGSHTWNYDPGVWKETKLEPDLWKIDFETKKRRARNAPSGSGAPVGTEYHWLIVAHQMVRKEDANTYSTHLVGSKYKLAHKNAQSGKWSVPGVMGQREREVELLQDAIRRVEGLPPVHKSQKVQETAKQKGQKTLDSMFAGGAKRKRVDDGGEGKA